MSSRTSSTDPDLLHGAAASALALARRTGTPCCIWRDGRVVDIAASEPPSAESVMRADAVTAG
jgi:hypothetical protein